MRIFGLEFREQRVVDLRTTPHQQERSTLGESSKSARPRRSARDFQLSTPNRLTQGFKTASKPYASSIRHGMARIRGISREFAMNNDYAKHYIRLLRTNVIGPSGIQLRPECVFEESGKLDERANTALRNGWVDWGKRVNSPEITGAMSMRMATELFIESVAKDGEVIIRHRRGVKHNKYRYSFQFIDPVLLDVELNKTLSNGRRIVMGVEVDDDRRPLAYYFRQPPRDPEQLYYSTGPHVRVPASEIEHCYLPEWIWQTRAMPWFTTALLRMGWLEQFEEAELVASVWASRKLAFLEKQEWYDESDGIENYAEEDGESDGEGGAMKDLLIDTDTGSFNEMPYGINVKPWDPTHPNIDAAAFVKSQLRGVASGLGVGYNPLANDLEGVTYGSLRGGMITEREVYQALQEWVIESFLEPVYREWLNMALLSGELKIGTASLRYDREAKYQQVRWQPRRWDWVDPAKDAKAIELKHKMRVVSLSSIIRSLGREPEEVFREIQAEKELMQKYGVKETEVAEKVAPKPSDSDEDEPDEDEPDEDEKGEQDT